MHWMRFLKDASNAGFHLSIKVVEKKLCQKEACKGIYHLSPSGPWIGPYNIKTLGPFGRPTSK